MPGQRKGMELGEVKQINGAECNEKANAVVATLCAVAGKGTTG